MCVCVFVIVLEKSLAFRSLSAAHPGCPAEIHSVMETLQTNNKSIRNERETERQRKREREEGLGSICFVLPP